MHIHAESFCRSPKSITALLIGYMSMHAKSLQSCPTLCDPSDSSPPDSSVYKILQTRILKKVAMPSTRGSSQIRDRTCISMSPSLAGDFFTTSTNWEALLMGYTPIQNKKVFLKKKNLPVLSEPSVFSLLRMPFPSFLPVDTRLICHNQSEVLPPPPSLLLSAISFPGSKRGESLPAGDFYYPNAHSGRHSR